MGRRVGRSVPTFLENAGLTVRPAIPNQRIKIELDPRNPAYLELQGFCRSLYSEYLRPLAVWEPTDRRPPLAPPGPPYDPTTMNLHFVGRTSRGRLLHLITAVSSSPGNVLIEGLGLSRGSYGSVVMWEIHGIILRRSGRQRTKKSHAIHLDRSWPCYRPMRKLLKKLNAWMPEYADIADGYRINRDAGRTSHRWKMRQARIRRLGIHVVGVRRVNGRFTKL